MEEKYNPIVLLFRLAHRYEIEVKLVATVDLANLKNTYIKILLKDPSAPPFIIIKDPNKPDASILLLSGSHVMNHESLEKAKDDLGRVEAFYEGKQPERFETYEQFLAWLQL